MLYIYIYNIYDFIVLNNRDLNIEQNNRDYDFGRTRAARAPTADNNLVTKSAV